jgi:hypothetical protein
VKGIHRTTMNFLSSYLFTFFTFQPRSSLRTCRISFPKWLQYLHVQLATMPSTSIRRIVLQGTSTTRDLGSSDRTRKAPILT